MDGPRDRDDPRQPPAGEDPLAHRLRWGWGDNTARDVRVVVAIALVLLVGAGFVVSRLTPPLTADGLEYVRETAELDDRSDEQLQDLARAVCAIDEPDLSLAAVADIATSDLGYPVSRIAVDAVRSAACPLG